MLALTYTFAGIALKTKPDTIVCMQKTCRGERKKSWHCETKEAPKDNTEFVWCWPSPGDSRACLQWFVFPLRLPWRKQIFIRKWLSIVDSFWVKNRSIHPLLSALWPHLRKPHRPWAWCLSLCGFMSRSVPLYQESLDSLGPPSSPVLKLFPQKIFLNHNSRIYRLLG